VALRRIGLQGKILAVLALGTLLLLGGALRGVLLLKSALHSFEELLATQATDERSVMNLEITFKKQVQEWKDVLLRGEDPALFRKHWGAFEVEEARARALATDLEASLRKRSAAQEADLAAQFVQAHRVLGEDYRAALRVAQAGPRGFDARAGDLRIRGRDRPPTALLEELATALKKDIEAGSTDTLQGSARASTSSLWLISLATLIATLAALFLLELWLRRPLRQLVGLVDRVAGGDLTTTLTIESGDELEDFARSFSNVVSSLRKVPERLGVSSRELEAVGVSLDNAAREQRKTITVHSAALQETQVTAQQIRQTAGLAARQANAVLEDVGAAEAKVRLGQEAVDRTIAILAEVHQEALLIGNQVEGFRDLTHKIDVIALTVKDLADQSNILALNAALEAVRSGEHGKGFAVVAREIRSLSDQSIRATTEVGQILRVINDAIGHAVSLTKSGQQRMNNGLSEIQRSGDSLRALLETVQSTASSMRQIASAVVQQTAGIEQIFTAVREQGEMMRSGERSLETLSGSLASLKDVTGEVTALAASYKL
jgi:methyl-accepting chemotaxis protein